ncbi:MAG: hypothetical protein DELT_01138 [Desulfovibrio sp.]
MSGKDSTFTWQFHRLGGLDQLTLRTAEELSHLGELNPKLWVALSCPATGLEFDKRTLALIDQDKDGRIRLPEVVEAVSWLTARLADPASMVDAPNELPLDRITPETPEGANLLHTAKSVLETLGKPEATAITYEDVAKALETAEKNTFNGDGVIGPQEEFGPEVVEFVTDALAVVGGVKDSSGDVGINEPIAKAFVEALEAWKVWRQTVDHTATPLDENTAEAWRLMQELTPKVEDYFLRTEMVSFAPWSCTEPPEGEKAQALEQGLLESTVLEDMPLARIEPDRPLSLAKGVNPAWRKRLARFATLVQPLLNGSDTLGRADWETLQAAFAPYKNALEQKPKLPALDVTIPPTGSIDQVGAERAERHLERNTLAPALELIAKDAAAPSASTDIADLERLVLYHANVHRLLMNFVSFYDFYSLREKATFQSGTLFLDGRSCHLCLPVTGDIDKHASLATLSQLFLVYCQCSRVKDGPGSEVETMGVVAAITAGSSDTLVAGRNGVFVDIAGRDWDTNVVKVVSNPISIRQAAWDPYKRLARTIGDQVSKFAASKQADMAKTLGSKATDAATGKAPAFDIGKSMGIFAAIGLALGAIGTAIASLAHALFSLSWWQFPLVFVGAFVLISGPSMVLAWLKLRKRTLGPLLEASGWAVNSVIPINLTMGGQLTGTALLPKNAHRSYNDPLRKPRRWPLVLGIVIGALIAGAAYLYFSGTALPFKLPFMK